MLRQIDLPQEDSPRIIYYYCYYFMLQDEITKLLEIKGNVQL